MTALGIGPIISSAMVAEIGTGDAFSKGRDFGAWFGLVRNSYRPATAQSSATYRSADQTR